MDACGLYKSCAQAWTRAGKGKGVPRAYVGTLSVCVSVCTCVHFRS
jgi:hypothetical protein